MISVSHISAGAVSSKYYHEDGYYSEKEGEERSSWHGQAAKEEGLTGPVNDDKLQELLGGIAPDGRNLARVDAEGKTSRRMGYDLTFSAPKDISIMALVAGDKRLIEIHDNAVAKTLVAAEKLGIKVRVYDPTTQDKIRVGDQKAMFAVFRHDTSRDLDPNIHSHALTINMAKGEDGKYRAITSEDLYKHRKVLDSIYKSHMATDTYAVGYDIRREGAHGDIRIDGMPDVVNKNFSKRGNSIKDAVRESIDPNKSAAAERAALFTRAKKEKNVDRDELRAQWIKEVDKTGHKSQDLFKLVREAHTRQNEERVNGQTGRQLVLSAVRHFSENETLYAKKDIVEFALNRSVVVKPDQVENAIQLQLDRGELFHAKARGMEDGMTDNKTVAREARMIGELIQGKKASHATMGRLSRWARNPEQAVTNSLKGSTLTKGQANSTKVILASNDRIVGVQGYAGTGKTYMLEKAQSMANRSGYTFEAIGPSSKSVEALNGSNLKATTASSFLIKAAQGGLGNKKNAVLVVDEASMISTKDMTDLLRLANKAEYNRVVLLGDTAQLASVGAGAAFRQLQESGMKVAYMNEIQRQKVPDLLAGVKDLAVRDVTAAFEKIGNRIHHDKKGEYVQTAAESYLKLTPEQRMVSGVIVQSNKARVDANLIIRDGLIEEGSVAKESVDKDHLNQINYSTEQKRFADTYERGHRIVVHTNLPGTNFKQGNELTVRSINTKENTLQVVGPDSKVRTLDPSSPKIAAGIGVYDLESRPYAKGDEVIFRQNDKAAGVINGTRGVVSGVGDNSLVVKTDDGLSIRMGNEDLALKTMDHSYTSTVHAYQGETVERIIIAMGAKEALTNASAAYVAVSRAKYEAELYTDKPGKLMTTLMEKTGISETAFDGLAAAQEKADREAEAERAHENRIEFPRAKDLIETEFDAMKEKAMEQKDDQNSGSDKGRNQDEKSPDRNTASQQMEREMRHAEGAELTPKDQAKTKDEEMEIER